MEKRDALRYRIAPLEMTPSEFRKVGSRLVERIAEFLCTLPERPVTVNESPWVIREALGTGSLPEDGNEAKDPLEEATNLLLRACVVNFRTSLEDIEALPGIILRIGREVDEAIRPAELKSE